MALFFVLAMGQAQEGQKPSRSGYVQVNGLDMYYEVHGQGKPLVMIHGSFMNIPLTWSELIPLLSQDHMLVLAEMQGHGRTKDIPRAMDYAHMADDVSGLLEHLDLEQADVLGYSMGGGVAFQMAIRHPGQVRRLIILSGTYAHDGWWPDVEASFANMNGEMFRGSPLEQEFVRYGNDPAQFDAYIEKVLSIDVNGYDWSGAVKKFELPVFLVLGDVDGIRYGHALDLFKALGGGKMGDLHGMPKSRLAILPATTHIGLIQRTELLVPMIRDFLASDLPPTPPGF